MWFVIWKNESVKKRREGAIEFCWLSNDNEEICNAKIPSIIIYKVGFINFLIIKFLVKTKYANIINFAANEEIIPELLQSNCSAKNIFKNVSFFLENPNKMNEQVKKVQNILNELKINGSSSELSSLSLNKFL